MNWLFVSKGIFVLECRKLIYRILLLTSKNLTVYVLLKHQCFCLIKKDFVNLMLVILLMTFV